MKNLAILLLCLSLCLLLTSCLAPLPADREPTATTIATAAPAAATAVPAQTPAPSTPAPATPEPATPAPATPEPATPTPVPLPPIVADFPQAYAALKGLDLNNTERRIIADVAVVLNDINQQNYRAARRQIEGPFVDSCEAMGLHTFRLHAVYKVDTYTPDRYLFKASVLLSYKNAAGEEHLQESIYFKSSDDKNSIYLSDPLLESDAQTSAAQQERFQWIRERFEADLGTEDLLVLLAMQDTTGGTHEN